MSNGILKVFRETINKIQDNYNTYGFVVERDFVWTVQKELILSLSQKNLCLDVFNDYPIEKGSKRSKSVDLIVLKSGISYRDILDGNSCAELVVEFKFEPSKKRSDICKHKLPVVFWREVNEDIVRIKRFVKEGKAATGITIFVDEFGRYHNNNYPVDSLSKWLTWGSYNTQFLDVSVLWTEADKDSC